MQICNMHQQMERRCKVRSSNHSYSEGLRFRHVLLERRLVLHVSFCTSASIEPQNRPVLCAFENTDKFVPVQAMKAYRVSRRTALLFLTLVTNWTGLFKFTPQSLYLKESTQVHIE